MLQVSFNGVDEFIEELKKEAGVGSIESSKIEGNVVRLSNLYTNSRISPNIKHVSLMATFVSNGHIVRLDRYCGDHWGINAASDQETIDKTKKYGDKIEAVCKELGLDVRAGLFEESKT